MAKKLFIPGPSEVGEEIREVIARPMIGHRSPEFSELHGRLRPKVQSLFHTRSPVYLSTSSATGIMEGAVRNCVGRRVLHLTCGAFSERWCQISRANGKEADAVSVEWGEPVLPEMVEEALGREDYDAVAVVHNETSTGVMNPLLEIAGAVRRSSDALLLVDVVSSLASVEVYTDDWGIDVALAGSQKGLGLPPGLTVFAVSPRALERAESVPDRGYYFDFLTFEKSAKKDQTPTTPVIPLLYGLDRRLDEILGNRGAWFERQRRMSEQCRAWGREHFALYAREGYESVSLTSVRNTRGISVAQLNRWLGEEKGVTISNGYGKIKEQTFRIGHMGDITEGDLEELLGWISEFVERG